jgi:RNA polymerase sigma-70 factor (ECF subfamily)
MTPTDDDLVALYRRGENDAFAQLYDRYAARLLRFLRSLGTTTEQCEDAAQAAWLKAIDKLPAYSPDGRFKAWLFRIAHRVWLDDVQSAWERKRSHNSASPNNDDDDSPEVSDRPDKAAPQPHAVAAKREERHKVDDALHELPDAMRQAVLLRIDSELTYQEIADTLYCPLGTAIWYVHEAQRRLQKMLGVIDE